MYQQIPIDSISDAVDTADVTTWDFVWALASIVVGIALSGLARSVVRRYSRRANLPANMIDLLGTIVMWSVVAISVVFGLTFIGLNVAPLWILIALVAIAFAIGGRSLLESFGAGVLLLARAPFEPGDLVELGDEKGVVHEVNSRVVIIDTIDGRRILIPNSQVISEPIVNMSHRPARMSELTLDVTYGTDLEHAIAVAKAAVADVASVLPEPPPLAQVDTFADSSVRIRLGIWHGSDLASEWAAIDAAARAVYARFKVEGIEFAFPQRTLWWGDDDAPTRDLGD